MVDRTEDWIQFETPEGKHLIGSPSYILGVLGLTDVRSRLSNLEERVKDLERPMRIEKILAILKSEGKPRSDHFIEKRVLNLSYRDFIVALDSGVLIKENHTGHNMYALPEWKDSTSLTKTEEANK